MQYAACRWRPNEGWWWCDASTCLGGRWHEGPTNFGVTGKLKNCRQWPAKRCVAANDARSLCVDASASSPRVMPPTSLCTLYTAAGSFRAFPALIAAEYSGIHNIKVETDLSEIQQKSPTGKAPILVVVNEENNTTITVFGSFSVARFLSSPTTSLLGNTPTQQSLVNSWMEFCAQEMELPASVWFYPVRIFV